MTWDAVLQRYKANSVPITQSEWRQLSLSICKDLAAGGTGLWATGPTKAVAASVQHALSVFNRDAAVYADCSGAVVPPGETTYSGFMDQLINVLQVIETERAADYSKKMDQYSSDVYDYGVRYNVDVTMLLRSIANSTGAGSSVTCADGWQSSSGGKQGVCSHHGGVL